LNDEIEKKIKKNKTIKKKLAIRRMKIKIKIKSELEGNDNIFYWRVKLKRKINLTKGQKNQKNKDKIEKIIYHKFRLN